MGSKSSNSSSSSFDPEKYGEWKEYKGKIEYIESDIKVNYLYWRDVPMIAKGKEIGLNVARGFSLGFSEIGCEGKDISHDIIVVSTNKGPNYVLEWLDENMLRPGYYDNSIVEDPDLRFALNAYECCFFSDTILEKQAIVILVKN